MLVVLDEVAVLGLAGAGAEVVIFAVLSLSLPPAKESKIPLYRAIRTNYYKNSERKAPTP